MSPETSPLRNNHGFGLLAAVFVVVTLSLFGLLLARYTVTSQTSSVEDQLWAQALYSAEATMQLNILRNDGGGGLAAAATPTVGQIPTAIDTNTFAGPATPAIIRVRATHATGVSREVEAKYIL
ncbi:MAG: hypothetical protein ACOY3Z_02405 [Thermodesulfobacteriota bacterium]